MSTTPQSTKKTMTILFSALVVDMLAFTCILPLFPSILNFYSQEKRRDFLYEGFSSSLKHFQNFIGAPHNERYNNVFFGGLLGSLFSALQFISSPTLGALSDRYGRRNMLLLSSFGTLLSYVIWMRAETFSLFVLSRFIGGLSKSNINVATAIVSDIYKPEDHPKGMALIGISYSVGFLVGPMIGAYFSSIAPQNSLYTTPAIFSICLTFVQFVLVAFLLPETLQFEQTKEKCVVKSNKLISISELFKFSAVNAPITDKVEMQKFGMVYFIYLFLYSGLEFTLPFLTHLRFDFGSMQQGKLYLFSGILMLPIQGYVVRRTPMHRQKKMAEIGIMCVIPAFLIVAVANSVTVLYIGLTFYGIASATVVSCLTSCLTSIYVKSDRGALTGVFRSIGALARAVGPIFASSLFWLVGPTSCYTVGGVLLLTPLILLRKIKNPVEIKSD